MAEWKKKGNASTVEDVIQENCGLSADELLNPKPVDSRAIKGMDEMAALIKEAIDKRQRVTVIGDYDADGITSSAILHQTLAYLGKPPVVKLPRRMSDGYGLSAQMVNEISSGLVITVDNGISAIDEVATLRAKGVDVCILDHHLPTKDEFGGNVLPQANVIVNPHVDPEYSDAYAFRHYCGAGLSYKLAELLVTDQKLLDRAAVLAAIGTVADVSPLIGDNRAIVKKGIELIRKDASVIPALSALNELAGIYLFNEESIGYKIGPILNAGGRMEDDGAKYGFWIMATAKDSLEMRNMASMLFQMNEERKTLMAEWETKIERIVVDECLYGNFPVCVYADIPEGIVGPLAGRLAEDMKAPAIILTNSSGEPGIIKGSGRTYGKADIRELIRPLDSLLTRVGGHSSAIGLSLKASDLEEFLNSAAGLGGFDSEPDETAWYDLEIDGKGSTIKELERTCQKYAPFGEGNPKPVFMARNVVLSPRYGQHYKVMGSDGSHLKLHGDGFDVVAFGKAGEFTGEMGEPHVVDLIGTISKNRFQFKDTLQIQATDLAVSKNTSRQTDSPLMAALAARNAVFAK